MEQDKKGVQDLLILFYSAGLRKHCYRMNIQEEKRNPFFQKTMLKNPKILQPNESQLQTFFSNLSSACFESVALFYPPVYKY